MSPIEYLKRGLKNASWADVGTAFELLTGEKICVPTQENYLGALIDMQDILDRVMPGGEKKDPVKPQAKPKKAKKEKSPPPPIEQEEPSFEDDQDEDEDDGKITQVAAIRVDGPKTKKCRTVPHSKEQVNHFKDDGKLAKDLIGHSRVLSKQFTGKETRPEFRQVKASCSICNREQTIHPDLAPKSLGEGERSNYVCENCLPKRS